MSCGIPKCSNSACPLKEWCYRYHIYVTGETETPINNGEFDEDLGICFSQIKRKPIDEDV